MRLNTLPIGLPFEGTRFDFDNAKDSKELLIGGAQLFQGYTVEQTEIFINRRDVRYYKSGDNISVRDEDFCSWTKQFYDQVEWLSIDFKRD